MLHDLTRHNIRPQRKMPGVDLRAVVGAVGLAAGGWGDPGEGLSQGDAESLRGDIGALQQEESDKLKKIKRGKTKTLDLAMRRRGSGNLPRAVSFFGPTHCRSDRWLM